MEDGIYVSLDEAREELKKRWNDLELRRKIEKELGDKFLPPFHDVPRAVFNHQICTPDNGLTFFYYCSKYIGAEPLAWENSNDLFVSFNEEKKGLGRLRVITNDGKKATVDIMNFHENEKRKLNECVLKNGKKLIDFHHELFNHCHCNVEIYDDDPKWLEDVSDVSRYYYLTFLHFIAHGVLFERFILSPEEDKKEAIFTNEVILPIFEKIKRKFGIKPLIVRLYPENQSEEEDFFWWCYPSNVNDYIIQYAKENNYLIKE